MKVEEATAIRELTAADLEAVSGGVVHEVCRTLMDITTAVAEEIGVRTTAATYTGPKILSALGIDPWA